MIQSRTKFTTSVDSNTLINFKRIIKKQEERGGKKGEGKLFSRFQFPAIREREIGVGEEQNLHTNRSETAAVFF